MDAELKHPRLQRLRCSVQNYNWGKRGAESQVAKLYASNSGSTIEENKPYAELWMGTHESGPSFVVESGVDNAVAMRSHTLSLKEWIAKNPNVLGQKVLDKWGCDLPFLFKVLSVAKALSIQAHPDKELAKQLHKRWPDIYKDDNHKPEMALAITDFEALCGFIPLKELKLVLSDVPEIVELVGTADANQILNTKEQDKEVKSLLRSVFTQLMSANKEMVTMVTSKLKSRLHMESQARQLTDKEELVLRLEKQYPADVGVISAFFFNHVKLHPGEALYLGPNELHAYILGECVECMATSDNVVRAGLTPKHRDIQTLCSMLTYKQGFPDILKGCAVKLSSYVTRYSPPFEEFEVDRCVLPGGASTVFTAVPGPSVFIITLGQGTMHVESSKDVITEGDAVFAPAGTKIYITSLSELHLYRAGLNDQFLQKQ